MFVVLIGYMVLGLGEWRGRRGCEQWSVVHEVEGSSIPKIRVLRIS